MRFVSLSCVALALVLLAGFTGPAVGQVKKDKDKVVAPGKGAAVFEVYKDLTKAYRFRLKNADGTTLAIASKGYKNRADCILAIEAIKKLAADAKIEEPVKKK